jgi:hypothetical protein
MNYVQAGSKVIEAIGQSVILKKEYYTEGSVFGEKIVESGTILTIKGILQPVSPQDIDTSAGILQVGDYYGFFHPEDKVVCSGTLLSGSLYENDLIQYPSGTTWFEIVSGHNEWIGTGSIFTSTVLRRLIQ